MANPTTRQVRSISRGGGLSTTGAELEALRQEFNVFVTQLRVLTAKLDADGTVTDTDYAALVTDAGVGPATISVICG